MTTLRFVLPPFACLVPLALLVCSLAVAQESYDPIRSYDAPTERYDSSGSYASSQNFDPPDRVARLSYADGEVSLQPANAKEWTAAVLNRPLTSGDTLWVGEDSRAELQIGSASIHLDRNTGFSFANLDDRSIDMNLTEGTLNVRVRRLDRNETVEIDTPNATVSLQREGEYRVSVEDGGRATVVAVRSGKSEISRNGRVFSLGSQQQGRFTGSNALTANVYAIEPRDAFEAWAYDRDKRDERSVSSRYVSSGVLGYEDLDDYGVWESDVSYGHVWYPRHVYSGWAPYRFGSWVWISPWGWTWMDQQPWGFAPFHYGRWAYLRSRWCWVPGPRHLRPVYAPALVGWVGGGSRGSHSFDHGNDGVGWFPLAPREVYIPRYRVSERYMRNVNISNTYVDNTNITNVLRTRGEDIRYVNQQAPGAVTTVASRPTISRATWINEREATAPSERENDAPRTSLAARPQQARDDREREVQQRPIRPESRTVDEQRAVERPAPRSPDTSQDSGREPREARPAPNDLPRSDPPPTRRDSQPSDPPRRRDQPSNEIKRWHPQERGELSHR